MVRFEQANGIKNVMSHEKKSAKNAHLVSLYGTQFNRGQWSGISFSVQMCIHTVLLAPFCLYRPWQQQEYEYFNSRRAVWFFPRRWRLRWHITGKLLKSTSGKLDQGVRDNSIKCSCWKDQAFWCCPSPLSSNCKAVTPPEIYNDKTDSCWLGTWHWGESGPGAHTHPSAPVSSQWQDSGAKDWHGGGGMGHANVSFSRAKHTASDAVWKHNCNENPIDRRSFPFRQIAMFSLPFSCLESQDETPGDIIVSVPSRWADLVSTFACTQSKKSWKKVAAPFSPQWNLWFFFFFFAFQSGYFLYSFVSL